MLCETLVDEEGFFTCGGVYADDRVLGIDSLSSHSSASLARVLSLGFARVNGVQPIEEFLEFRRKAVVGFDLREEEGVTSDFGLRGLVRNGRVRGQKKIPTLSRSQKNVVAGGCFS